MWYVYVLVSLTSGKLYVGITQHLERRIHEHNDGKSKFTSGHMPWRLIYFEELPDTQSARDREKYLKSAAGKRFLKKFLGSAGSLPD
ncbi:MAG TPA: GIY-YIG nuclease family protein [Chryseosolibacter sp.]|nr:GIY-YIG nuclease family protein [Chryseosolibacter sp.]